MAPGEVELAIASDYAVLEVGEWRFYYGYEVTTGEQDGDEWDASGGEWCFEAKFQGRRVGDLVPFSVLKKAGDCGDRERCEWMLLVGIGLLLGDVRELILSDAAGDAPPPVPIPAEPAPEDAGYEVALEFTTDEPAYCYGFEMGVLWAELKRGVPKWEGSIHTENVEQVRVMARRLGYQVETRPIAEGWVSCDLWRKE